METSAKTNGSKPVLRRAFTEEFKNKAVARVIQGETYQAVSEDIGVVHSVIRGWAKHAGVPPRLAKRAPLKTGRSKDARGHNVFSDEYKRDAVRRWQAGENRVKLIKELKITSGMFSTWAKNYSADTPIKKSHPLPVTATAVGDALRLLRHAKTAMYAALQRGEIKEFSEVHMLVLMALTELQKT